MHASFQELLLAATQCGSIGSAVALKEAELGEVPVTEVRARMRETLEVMRQSAGQGRAGAAQSRSGLVGGDAARVGDGPSPFGELFRDIIRDALATSEVNATMGRIVAAPTAGASGVLPGVLLPLAEARQASEDDLIDALFAAAGIGGVVSARATLSGAAAGCQAEVGTGAAMAAAAATQLCGGTPAQVGHAAALALQGLLGLVCDPIGGLVEVPCVVRNATGAAVALAATQMALSGVAFPVSFDSVADAMSSIGDALPATLRETAQGGLAVTLEGQAIAEQLERTGP